MDTIYINSDDAKEMMNKAVMEHLAGEPDIAAPKDFEFYKPYATEIEIPIRLH